MADLAATLRANAQRTAAIVAHARRTGQAKRPTGRVPMFQWPTRIEEDYARAIAALADVRDELEPLMRALPELLAGTARELGRTDEGESARARQLLQRAKAKLDASLGDHALEPATRRYAQRTLAHHQGQLQRQMRARLGVDLSTADPGAAAMVETFVSENVALIRSLGTRTLDDVAALVTRAFSDGARAESIVEEIQARYGIAERHARLIAGDQIGKLNGRIAAARHQELGIGRFRWRTLKDPKVRPRHVELNGQVFAYPDGAPGEGIPGRPIRCRCWQEPIVDDILAELEALEAGGAVAPAAAGGPGAVAAAPGGARGPPPPPSGGGGGGQPPGPGAPPAGGGGRRRRTPAQERALAAIDVEKIRPMATSLHPNMRDPQRLLTEQRRADFEVHMRRVFGKRITFEEVSHAYAVPDGFEARLVDLTERGVEWSIYRSADGALVGELHRDFYGRGVVHHGLFLLRDEFRGSGISDFVNGNALRRYEKWGAKEIDVTAAWAGRYAWARFGFRPASSAVESYMLEGFLDYLDRIGLQGPKRDRLVARATRSIGRRPWDVAALDNGVLYPDEFNMEAARKRVLDRGGSRVQADRAAAAVPPIPLGRAFFLSRNCPQWNGKIVVSRRDAGYLRAIVKAKVAP